MTAVGPDTFALTVVNIFISDDETNNIPLLFANMEWPEECL
jgi:hypothetical protein